MLKFFGDHFCLLAKLLAYVGQEVVGVHGFDVFGFTSTERFECILLKELHAVSLAEVTINVYDRVIEISFFLRMECLL